MGTVDDRDVVVVVVPSSSFEVVQLLSAHVL